MSPSTITILFLLFAIVMFVMEQIQEPYLWLALSAVPARMQHLLECRQIPWYLEQAVTLS